MVLVYTPASEIYLQDIFKSTNEECRDDRATGPHEASLLKTFRISVSMKI